jgi:hypothetical protein
MSASAHTTPPASLTPRPPSSQFLPRPRTPALATRDLPLPWDRLEQDVVDWSRRALTQARERQQALPSTRLIPRIIQYLSGAQWPARPTAYGNSRPVTNRMFRQYWELVSLLTDGRPEPQIKVWDTHDGYSEAQRLLLDLLEPWASHPGYHDALQDVIGLGFLSHGVGKVQWNPHLAGGMGDVQLLSINPLLFFKLGGDGPLDECECVIEERAVTMEALYRRHGKLALLVKPETSPDSSSLQPMRPSAISSDQWSKFSPQMQQVLGVRGGGAGGSSDALYPIVREHLLWFRDPARNETSRTIRVGPPAANWSYFVEPGCPLFPRGRVLSVAGGRVLEDTCNPYFHSHGPTAPGPYVEFLPLRTAWSSGASSMSVMGNLIGPQDILNRLMAGMLETIKAGLTPTIITPEGAISRSDLDNISTTISGGKIEYNALRTAGQAPRFREQAPFPTAAQWYTQTLMREMDQTTGSAAIDAAAQKEQIPSHDTMELIQNSRSGMVRLMGRRLETFLNRVGQMVVADMLQFYTLGHRTAIRGDRGLTGWDFTPMYGSLIPRTTAPERFVRKFQFEIRTGSALSFDRETRLQAAILLNRQGLLSNRAVLRALNAAGANIDIDLNEKEQSQEQLQKLALAALSGMAASARKSGGKK